MLKNKKSIELSLNFMVIIIISIVIFGFGMVFLSKLASQAEDIRKLTLNQIDGRISSLICEGSDRVCIAVTSKSIQRSKFGIFGVKIFNILETQDFQIEVKPSNPLGFKQDNTPITGPPLIINPLSRTINIGQNEEKDFGIGVQVPPNAPVGSTYILNVEIKTSDGSLYVPGVQKLYVLTS